MKLLLDTCGHSRNESCRHLARCEVPDIPPKKLNELFLGVTPCPTSLKGLQTILSTCDEPPQLLWDTLSCLAYFWFRIHSGYYDFTWQEAVIQNNALVNAAFYANLCAYMEFVPRSVILVADWLAYLSRRWDVDLRTHARYGLFKDLFRVYDEYLAAQATAEAFRAAKVAQHPNAYRCAVSNCGIQATSRSALRRCGGNCAPDVKPHYCSVDCQERVCVLSQLRAHA